MPRKRASAGTANPDVQNDDGEAQNPPKKPRFTTFGWAFALFRICSFHLQKLHGWTVRVAARAPKEEKEKTLKNLYALILQHAIGYAQTADRGTVRCMHPCALPTAGMAVR